MTLRGDQDVFRIHGAASALWHFSDGGSGRFDPIGTDFGSCYFAGAPIGAWIEVFRKQMLLPEDDVRKRVLATVRIGHDLTLADLTSRRALQFGVTASLGANEDYAPSQRWAADAVRAGFDGVRYLVRHDPAQSIFGYAIFGTHEVGDESASVDATAVDALIPEELIAEASREFGYRVIPTP